MFVMNLNVWMMVERYPNLKEELGGWILGCEISSLLDRLFARWSTASFALTLAFRPSVSNEKKRDTTLCTPPSKLSSHVGPCHGFGSIRARKYMHSEWQELKLGIVHVKLPANSRLLENCGVASIVIFFTFFFLRLKKLTFFEANRWP